MSETFDFGFEKVNVTITDIIGYKTDKETGEQVPIVHAIFKGKNNPKLTKHECSQEDPLEDILKDVNSIENGIISGTKFYKHWMKIFFEEGKVYDFVKKDGFKIERFKGKFLRQDKYKQKTFYFEINGKSKPVKGYYYEVDGYKYLL